MALQLGQRLRDLCLDRPQLAAEMQAFPLAVSCYQEAVLSLREHGARSPLFEQALQVRCAPSTQTLPGLWEPCWLAAPWAGLYFRRAAYQAGVPWLPRRARRRSAVHHPPTADPSAACVLAVLREPGVTLLPSLLASWHLLRAALQRAHPALPRLQPPPRGAGGAPDGQGVGPRGAAPCGHSRRGAALPGGACAGRHL